MCTTDNLEDRLSIVRMNAELRNAELELLSAHCATYKLRLRFSTEYLARHGRRDTLRKSIETANALHQYYSSIDRHIPSEENVSSSTNLGLEEKQILHAIDSVSSYLRAERERYLSSALPLFPEHRKFMQPYFEPDLLNEVRFVQLLGTRLSNPPFYAEAKNLGFLNLPDISHMNSMTFLDVLVFNEQLTERSLFHALVHAVQFRVLGIERYTELFVRNFVNSRFHFLVPLEAHAFHLESKFARPGAGTFSVEEQIRVWAKQNRY
jgi:hypothetical protein